MYNFMPVLAALSRVVLVFSVTFFVPWAWSWWGDEHRLQEVWLLSFAVTFICGALVMWRTQRHRRELMPKDGFMLVNLVWAVLPAFAALPLWLGVPEMDWTDAYFEAVS
ncbi:MAG: TrkH family potassium uptake protein, partial [Burkholderiaceae bacterium]